MKIKIQNKYEIVSTPDCYVIYRLSIIGENVIPYLKQAKQENIGKEKRVIVGYYTTIESVIEHFPDRLLLDSAAETLLEAVQEVKNLYQLLYKEITGKLPPKKDKNLYESDSKKAISLSRKAGK